MTEVRLWKSYGVTHAVPSFKTQSSSKLLVTLCRRKTDVPWRSTSKRRMSKIDCMGCLVALGRT